MKSRHFGALILALGVFANMAVWIDLSYARGGRGGGGGLRGGGMSSVSRGGGGGFSRSSGGFSRSSGGYSRASSGMNRSSYSRPSGAATRGAGRAGEYGANRSVGANRTVGDRNIGGARSVGDRDVRRDVSNRSGNRVNNIRGDTYNRVGNNNINIDNDGGWGGWDDHIHHPIAAGMAVGTAAAITAAAIGSTYYSVPPGCGPYAWGGYSYYNCGGYYLEPRYEGDTVVYVTVPDPASQ